MKYWRRIVLYICMQKSSWRVKETKQNKIEHIWRRAFWCEFIYGHFAKIKQQQQEQKQAL